MTKKTKRELELEVARLTGENGALKAIVDAERKARTREPVKTPDVHHAHGYIALKNNGAIDWQINPTIDDDGVVLRVDGASVGLAPGETTFHGEWGSMTFDDSGIRFTAKSGTTIASH